MIWKPLSFALWFKHLPLPNSSTMVIIYKIHSKQHTLSMCLSSFISFSLEEVEWIGLPTELGSSWPAIILKLYTVVLVQNIIIIIYYEFTGIILFIIMVTTIPSLSLSDELVRFFKSSSIKQMHVWGNYTRAMGVPSLEN